MQVSGSGDGLRAAGSVKLLQDVVQVRFDRAHCQKELPGNFAIGPASRDQLQDFQFALAERLNE